MGREGGEGAGGHNTVNTEHKWVVAGLPDDTPVSSLTSLTAATAERRERERETEVEPWLLNLRYMYIHSTHLHLQKSQQALLEISIEPSVGKTL